MKKSVVMPIIGINVVVFILQVILGDWFTNLFAVKLGDFPSHFWTLLTSVFMHGSFSHILFNMISLYFIGSFIESKIGTKRFLMLYLISGIFASFISSFFYIKALGASGAIMGIFGVAIILIPHLKVIVFPIPIPMSLRTVGIIYIIMDILGIFPGIAHLAHLAGVIIGLLYGFILKRNKRKFHKKFRTKSDMSPDDIEEYIKNGRL